MTITKTLTAKIAAAVAGVAMVLAFAFSFAVPAHAALSETQIQAIISLLQSFGADSATIANVDASLRGTTPSTPSNPGSGSSTACYNFTRDLTLGATGADVMELQKFLNANGAMVAASGAGSPGNESSYFGGLTQSALAKWQAANGVSPAAGYFGPLTRAAVAAKCSANPGTPGTPGTPSVGSGLSVVAASQPQNAIAPQNASRVPFTRVTLTAGNDGAVTVNSVTVQRVGLGNNAAFAGVVLIDQDGNQLGTSKTFNSNDQATIGEPITIPAGQSRTFTVAANMGSSLASYAGQVPAIAVVGVNTSATVSGSLPITGAYHTINATLTVGSVTIAASTAYSTNANATKEIGTTGYRATGLRLTAGSAEDIRLKMLRYNQTGSASTVNDLANIQVVVDGTAYPASVSADGKYVTANFGSGILVPKGNSIETYIQYDIVGGNSANRTVIFDVDKTTDIFFEGATYGYGISPAAGGSAVPSSRGTFTITSGTPFIYSTQTTISGASVTTIGKSNTVPAQNVSVNLANQPLGGFEVDIKGEAITVQQMVFTVATSSASIGSGQLTNITLVDQNGAVVAGPVDSTGSTASRTITFTDSVTFPTGKRVYTLRGKVPSTATSGAVITVSTTPSSGWTNVKGEITGNTISLSQGQFAMNAMTVKAGALAIGVDTTPASQTIVAGGQDVTFVNFQLDASQSGEDVRISSFLTSLAYATGAATDISSCRFFDGSSVLNTGSNVLNPSGTSPIASTVVFDNPLTIAKGTVKTIALKCNVSGSATNNGTFAFDHGTIGSFSVTGATSGNTITATDGTGSAPTMTIGTGSASVTTDASSPGFSLVAAGSVDQVVGALKFTATNEAVNLQRVGLKLTNTASSSPKDLVKVSLWDGANKVGEAVFVGTSNYATSTLSTPVAIAKNVDKTITVKADFANINSDAAVPFSGHLVAIDVDTSGSNTQGVGAQSGSTINFTGSSAVSGVRVMKSYPVLALDTLPSTGIADGRLMRFKVTADAKGPVSIARFGLNLATTTASVTNVTIYGFTDANYSLPISGVGTDGNLQQTNDATVPSTGNVQVEVVNSSGSATTIQVPAGQTRYFEARGSVAGATSGASVTTKLLGSSSFPSTAAGVAANPLRTVAGVATGSGSNFIFIWSPNSTTTPSQSSQDWTNGFGVSGLPSGGLIQTRSQ